MLSREATNTNFIVFGFARSGLEPTIYPLDAGKFEIKMFKFNIIISILFISEHLLVSVWLVVKVIFLKMVRAISCV